jgi:hypothetical protein
VVNSAYSAAVLGELGDLRFLLRESSKSQNAEAAGFAEKVDAHWLSRARHSIIRRS